MKKEFEQKLFLWRKGLGSMFPPAEPVLSGLLCHQLAESTPQVAFLSPSWLIRILSLLPLYKRTRSPCYDIHEFIEFSPQSAHA